MRSSKIKAFRLALVRTGHLIGPGVLLKKSKTKTTKSVAQVSFSQKSHNSFLNFYQLDGKNLSYPFV